MTVMPPNAAPNPPTPACGDGRHGERRRPLLALGALIVVAWLLAPAAIAGDGAGEGDDEKLAAIRAVQIALEADPAISPELKSALAELLGVMEQEARYDVDQADLQASLQRLQLAESESAPVIASFRDLQEKLTISGDLRLRQEQDVNRDDRGSRSRSRLRARVEGRYAVSDDVTVGARMVTGDPADANTSHTDLGDGFDKLELDLDRAFAEYRPQGSSWWVRGGKFAHPFVMNPVFGQLVWDMDVQPEGIAGGRTFEGLAGIDQVELVAGSYVAIEQSAGDDARAYVAQVTARDDLGGKAVASAAVGLYHYDDLSPDGSAVITADNQGNALDANGDFKSDFTILNPILAVTFDADGRPLTFATEAMRNLEASGNHDAGWAAGVSYGETRQPGSSQWYWQYQLIEQDAILTAVVEDDFLNATHFRGHVFGWRHQLQEQVRLHLWAIITKRLSGFDGATPADRHHQWRLRVDLDFWF
jgi:ribosomal protein S13